MSSEIWFAKAQRNLQSAKLLLAAGDTDSACNRAYYSMFHAARAALFSVGQHERAMGKTHSGMIASFSEFLVKSKLLAPENGRNLGLESNRRLLSDYEGDVLTNQDASASIERADSFLAAVQAIIAHETNEQGS